MCVCCCAQQQTNTDHNKQQSFSSQFSSVSFCDDRRDSYASVRLQGKRVLSMHVVRNNVAANHSAQR
jgi:hypothetical protein